VTHLGGGIIRVKSLYVGAATKSDMTSFVFDCVLPPFSLAPPPNMAMIPACLPFWHPRLLANSHPRLQRQETRQEAGENKWVGMGMKWTTIMRRGYSYSALFSLLCLFPSTQIRYFRPPFFPFCSPSRRRPRGRRNNEAGKPGRKRVEG
jgi:hypothetical protein